MSKLSIDISPDQYQRIKTMAAIEGKSVENFVLERIFDPKSVKSISDEDIAWEKLISLLKDRIADAEAGGISSKTLDQLSEEIVRRHNGSKI